MKTCHICKSLFEGSGGRCSSCNKIYMREYRAANLEKVKQGQKDHYSRNKDAIKEKVKKYAEENKEKVKISKQKYFIKNREKILENHKRWREKNYEKVKESQRIGCLNRIARKKNAEGKHTASDIKELLRNQAGLCNICKKDVRGKYHVDHMIPLSRGGSNWPSNLQILCPSCNCKKFNKTNEEFMKYLEISNG